MGNKEIYESNEKSKDVHEIIQLLVNLIKVKSSVKNNVTEDYTLADLGESEREFIIENYQNSEYVKNLGLKYKTEVQYKWNEQLGDWERDEYNKPIKSEMSSEDKKIIENKCDELFDFFMVRPHMIAILARNKSSNFIVKLLGKYKDDEEKIVAEYDERSMADRTKDFLTGGGEA